MNAEELQQLKDRLNFSSGYANVNCTIFAPLSEYFAKNVYEAWGAGGIVFLTVPPVLTVISLAIYIECIWYIFLKSNSKDLRNSLLWLLGTHPAIMCIGTVALFMPRALVYLNFMTNVYVAYAIYKFYYLVMVFAGGTKSFVDKSSEKSIRTNLLPCCCWVCLPKIRNSEYVLDVAKWLVLQNAIVTPLIGAIAMLLKTDLKLYSLNGISASAVLSLFNSIATLICMYGFKMINKFTTQITGMEETHAMKGKNLCIQLTMFLVGFEGLIFNLLAQAGVFPCTLPFNFNSRRRAFNNYAVIIQSFLLFLLMRKFFRRRSDIQRQVTLSDSLTSVEVVVGNRSSSPANQQAHPDYGSSNAVEAPFAGEARLAFSDQNHHIDSDKRCIVLDTDAGVGEDSA